MEEILLDAQALATFSNLAPHKEEEFQNSIYPCFLPSDFWDTKTATTTGERPWQSLQAFLSEVWKKGFPLEEAIQLIVCVDKNTKTAQRLEAALNMSNEEVLSMEIKPEVWPFQRAVMYLAVNPWRARFCLRCGKRFVALKPRNVYCGDDCSRESRKGTKRNWWNQTGTVQRKAASKAKSRKSKKKS